MKKRIRTTVAKKATAVDASPAQVQNRRRHGRSPVAVSRGRGVRCRRSAEPLLCAGSRGRRGGGGDGENDGRVVAAAV